MQLRLHTGPSALNEFAPIAGSLYRRNPVAHTVELTLLRGGPLPGEDTPLFLTVWDGDEVVGAAMQTPPSPLLCSGIPLSAVDDVVDTLAANAWLSGGRGPKDTALAFATRWQAVTGAAVETDSGERLYRLATLNPPVDVGGTARIANRDDEAVLVDYQCGFAAEAFGHVPDPVKAKAAIAAAAAAGDAYLLWAVDDVVVSMAGVRSAAARWCCSPTSQTRFRTRSTPGSASNRSPTGCAFCSPDDGIPHRNAAGRRVRYGCVKDLNPHPGTAQQQVLEAARGQHRQGSEPLVRPGEGVGGLR